MEILMPRLGLTMEQGLSYAGMSRLERSSKKGRNYLMWKATK
jgi:hypothetical protein